MYNAVLPSMVQMQLNFNALGEKYRKALQKRDRLRSPKKVPSTFDRFVEFLVAASNAPYEASITQMLAPLVLVICATKAVALTVAAQLPLPVQVFFHMQDASAANVAARIVVATAGKGYDVVKHKRLDARHLRCLAVLESDLLMMEDWQMGTYVYAMRKLLPPDVVACSEGFMKGQQRPPLGRTERPTERRQSKPEPPEAVLEAKWQQSLISRRVRS